jgi:tetratricopeptide (TPR) repeat protein
MRTRWRLISEPDRTVIWSDQVDENLNAAEALNVEDRIAEGVARLVASSDGIVAQAELHKPALRSTLGYQCILKAQAYVQSLSVTLHAEARDCLEATVAQNPEDAEAWALLSYIYVDESRNGFNPRGDTKDIWARAMAASNRALELAPWSSLVQQMRSTVLYQTGDYIGFEQAGRKAIELNPGNPFRYFFLGNRLFALGHYEEGNAMVRKGLALDPLPSATHHGTTLLESYRLGRYKDAADEAATLDLDPNYYLIDVIIAAIDGQLGDRTAAAPHVAKVLKLRPDYAKTFRLDWRTRHFREDFIEKVAEGLRKAGLNVE